MIQVEGIFSGGGGSSISAPIIGKDFNWTGGDGTYQVLDDGGGNWRIKFLSSGTFTPLRDMVIDVFLVGAGGGGAGAGAGAGYTNTTKSVVLAAGTSYSIEIGSGGTPGESYSSGTAGGNTSAFSATANGGFGGGGTLSPSGGNGGSGGGAKDANGGIDGANGSSAGDYKGGTGQGTTTREFGESTGDLYASGGSGVSSGAAAGADNTGDGGDYKKAGGSGIVIIRKHKEAAA